MQKHPPAADPAHPPDRSALPGRSALPDLTVPPTPSAPPVVSAPPVLFELPDPSVPPTPSAPPVVSAPPVPSRAALLARLRGGPGGPGTSTLRIRPALPPPAPAPAPAAMPFPTPAAVPTPAAPGRSRGNPAVPELYCPPPQRDDPALAEAVDDRLIAWAEETGIYAGRLDDVRELSLGRYTMLTFAHVEDPDRLLAPAKCTLAQWATDDYYCDDESAGAVPLQIATHLSQALAAIDPAHLPARYAPRLEQAMRADPVLVALRSSTGHLSRYATRSQLTRYRHEMAALFSGYTAEAGWRVSGRTPSVWEFLAVRQDNSFIPTMVMLDPAGGYELPVEAYADPRVRGAVLKAASASVIVNDLYSMHREDESAAVNYNLPALIEAEEGCSRAEAVRRSADLHDELVRAFEEESALLVAAGFPTLIRFQIWNGTAPPTATTPRAGTRPGTTARRTVRSTARRTARTEGPRHDHPRSPHPRGRSGGPAGRPQHRGRPEARDHHQVRPPDAGHQLPLAAARTALGGRHRGHLPRQPATEPRRGPRPGLLRADRRRRRAHPRPHPG